MMKALRGLGTIVAVIVALLHLGFLVLEMFLWTEPFGLSVFDMTPEEAEVSAVLAANQGLYNGFLAAGILWSLIRGLQEMLYFFLACVIVAGIYGALSVSPTIFLVQALPASVALVLLLATRTAQ
ncbi:MAG: DUF1304 domain-containing protein [Pseudomonadota bacterium]